MTIMVSLKFFIEMLGGGRGRFEASSNKFQEWIPYLCQVISSEKWGTTYRNLFSIFDPLESPVSGGKQLNELHGWGGGGRGREGVRKELNCVFFCCKTSCKLTRKTHGPDKCFVTQYILTNSTLQFVHYDTGCKMC